MEKKVYFFLFNAYWPFLILVTVGVTNFIALIEEIDAPQEEIYHYRNTSL